MTYAVIFVFSNTRKPERQAVRKIGPLPAPVVARPRRSVLAPSGVCRDTISRRETPGRFASRIRTAGRLADRRNRAWSPNVFADKITRRIFNGTPPVEQQVTTTLPRSTARGRFRVTVTAKRPRRGGGGVGGPCIRRGAHDSRRRRTGDLTVGPRGSLIRNGAFPRLTVVSRAHGTTSKPYRACLP